MLGGGAPSGSNGPVPAARTGPLLLLLVLGAALYLPFLGARDLWYPDEPDVAVPAKEMRARGDLVTPTHGGEPWIDYPPLVYWGALASAAAFGRLDETTLRLPTALCAIALALLVAAFAERRLGPGRGLLAGAALLTFPMFAYQATNVHPDMAFALLQAAGLMLYAAAEAWTPRTAWSARVAAFGLLGLSILAKGPLGLLLPGLVLTLWHLSRGELRRALLLAPLGLVALAVAFPWYAALAARHGWDWVLGELHAQNVARFAAGTSRGHARPWFYYAERLPGDVGLWIAALLPALALGLRARAWGDPLRRLLLLWALVPPLFLSFAATKRQVYLLPCAPAFALLIADLLAGATTLRAGLWRPVVPALLRGLAWTACAGAAAGALAGAVGFLLGPHLAWNVLTLRDDLRPMIASLAPAGLALALAGPPVALLAWSALRRDRPGRALLALVALHGVPWIVLLGLVLPRLGPWSGYAPHVRALTAPMPAGEPLGFLAPGREVLRRCVFLYYGDRPLALLADGDALAAFLAGGPGRRAVVEADLAARLLSEDARFAGSERGRFQVEAYRWVVLGPP